MAAVGIDRENLGTFADQQNLLVTDMADQLSIPEIAGIDTLRQVWSTRLSLLLGHRLTLHGYAAPDARDTIAFSRRTVSHRR
jgi:hypothetical protein